MTSSCNITSTSVLSVTLQTSVLLQLDDTLSLIAIIQKPYYINQHIEYCIKVQRKFENGDWTVSKRYNDFVSLHSALKDSGIKLPLPPKKVIGNMKPNFVAERQLALQVFLDSILNNKILASTLAVKLFLDPKNYKGLTEDIILQNVSMVLRGSSSYKIKTCLPNIGWRIRKHYFLVTDSSDGPEEFILSWQNFGPDKILSEEQTNVVFRNILNLNHPFIDKLYIIRNYQSGAYVVRKLHPMGSVKDLIYGTQFKDTYLSKYGYPKQVKPFTIGQVAHYGYQILQALKYLHDNGFYYGHLHTGNLAIENQRIILLDIENSICGAPPFIRQYIISHSKLNTPEAIEMYSFGHTLYEMAYGSALTVSTCDEFPTGNLELVAVLRSILSKDACKKGLPTLEMVMKDSFFLSVSSILDYQVGANVQNGSVKLSNQCLNYLNCVKTSIIKRIVQDQKSLKLERKQTKIQEILNSDSEVAKQKRKTVSKESRDVKNKPSNNKNDELSPTNVSISSERSESGASSLSTISSPTPSHIDESLKNSEQTLPVSQNRSTFLQSICSFNKDNLHRIKK